MEIQLKDFMIPEVRIRINDLKQKKIPLVRSIIILHQKLKENNKIPTTNNNDKNNTTNYWIILYSGFCEQKVLEV
ncbi:MAG: hypothetical protein KKA84_09365 [Bacteroidetes bacterium]|nr:hypothetical protein [Bacteroidota bacterium]